MIVIALNGQMSTCEACMVVSAACKYCTVCVCVYKSVSLNKGFDHNNQPLMLHYRCRLTQTVDHKGPFAPQVVTALGFGFVTGLIWLEVFRVNLYRHRLKEKAKYSH